jgi:hypothetical protein
MPIATPALRRQIKQVPQRPEQIEVARLFGGTPLRIE